MMAKWKKAACLLMLALFAVMLLPTAAMAEASGSVSLSSEGKTNAKTAFAAAKITGETVPSSWFSFEYETSTEGSYTSGSAPTGFPENVASGALADSLEGFKTVTVEGVAYTYELAYVTAEGNKVADVAAHNSAIYYRAVGGNVAGVKLNTNQKIVIRYARSHNTYTATYTHNTTLEEDKQGTFVGAEQVREGGTLEFSYTPSKYVQSYTVKVNGTKVTEANGKYTVSNVTADLAITVEETARTQYKLTYDGSNTNYTSGITTGKTDGKAYNKQVSCETFTFGFRGDHQWSHESKTLNQVRVTVASTEYMIALPTAGKTTSTTIGDGIVVELTCSANTTSYDCGRLCDIRSYTYTMTIKNCYEDLSVYINFKDTKRVEAWLVERRGVDPLYSKDALFSTKTHYWAESTDQTFIGIDGTPANKDYVFYLKASEGYENPVLTLVVDGTQYVLSDSNPKQVIKSGNNGVEATLEKGSYSQNGVTYTHKFTLPLSKASSNSLYDWRIYLSATVKSYSYAVRYDLRGGTATGIEGSTGLQLADNFAVTTIEPTKARSVFKGWTDDSSATTANKTAGGLYKISDCKYAEDLTADPTGKTAYVTLYALWEEIPTTDAMYTIEVSFDGGTPISIQEHANIGNDLSIFESELQQYLEDKGYDYDLDDYELNPDTPLEKKGYYVVQANGSLVITLEYHSPVTINYVAVCEDADATNFVSVSPTIENVPYYTGTPSGSTPTAGTGYTFKAWYTDVACTTPVTSGVDGTTNKLVPSKTAATYYALFEKATTDLTVQKHVTGLMGDKTYGFTFGCSTDNITWTTSFTLKDYATNGNVTQTISGVTIGSTLYFREEAVAGYSAPTIGYGSDAVAVGKTEDGKYWTWSITVKDGQTMTVTNNNGTQPDTGVILDSLPYVLILALVALGAVGAVVRRRRSREDD